MHKMAKACTPEQYGVPLHLRGHLKKWRGTRRNFSGASRRTGVPTANGVDRLTIKQRWTIVLPPPK